MKLKDLLNGRKKLKEYDELKEAQKEFSQIKSEEDKTMRNLYCLGITSVLTPRVVNVILSALEAEIAKLEEE